MSLDEETAQYLDKIAGELNFANLNAYEIYWCQEKVDFADLLQMILQERHWNWKRILEDLLQCLLTEFQNSTRMVAVLLLISVGYFVVARILPEKRRQAGDLAFLSCFGGVLAVVLEWFLRMSRIAGTGVEQMMEYLELLIPAFATTITLSGKLSSAAVFYELTFGLLWGCQWMVRYIILPGIHIYILLVLIDRLDAERMLAGIADLVKSGIQLAIRMITGAVVGIGSVQSLLGSARDRIAEHAVLKGFSVLPGVGNGFEFAEEVIVSCGGLVKNCVGVAGIVVLALIGIGPLLQLMAGYVCSRVGAALMRLLWDKGIAGCMEQVAGAVRLLVKLTGMTMIWFLLSILMVMTATSF